MHRIPRKDTSKRIILFSSIIAALLAAAATFHDDGDQRPQASDATLAPDATCSTHCRNCAANQPVETPDLAAIRGRGERTTTYFPGSRDASGMGSE